MMNNTFQTADEMWASAIGQVLIAGARTTSRNGDSHELIGWSGMLTNPRFNFVFNPRRKLSPYYAAGEMLWYLTGSQNAQFIRDFAPSYSKFCEDDGSAHGAYGARWAFGSQLQLLQQLLRERPDTRQAILTSWNASEPFLDLKHAVSGDRKDLPCTLSLQFFARESTLHCITTMRSNDVWLGMPYDIFCFTSLQAMLADVLDLSVGSYTHNVGSLHIYGKHIEACGEAWKTRFSQSFQAWSMPGARGHNDFFKYMQRLLTESDPVKEVLRVLDQYEPSLVRSLLTLYCSWHMKSRELNSYLERALQEHTILFKLEQTSSHP